MFFPTLAIRSRQASGNIRGSDVPVSISIGAGSAGTILIIGNDYDSIPLLPNTNNSELILGNTNVDVPLIASTTNTNLILGTSEISLSLSLTS